MKITGIKFLNLNSLKGQHEIRFDQPPFTESGIFAITGPTGAGKTTLLDAITAALYGRVHRHSKDVFEIMTRHTAESYAEVEFEVGSKAYRAKWSIRRSRGKADGQLQTQKMELAEADTGKIIIEHPLNEVRDEIVRLCGLDYNQFLRSVILSQGDFTRFLKADENERSELLEKITDTGIYSDISIAAYEKAREERLKLDQLRNKLENVVLLSTEERTVYVNELAELSLRETQLKQQEASLKSQLDWLAGLEKLAAKQQELLAELSAAERSHAANEPRFQRLQQHLKALVYRPALAELNTISFQQQRIETELKAVAQEQPAAVEEEKVIREALMLAKEQSMLKERALTEMEPVFDVVSRKDILIAEAGTQSARTLLSQTSLRQQIQQIRQTEEALILKLEQTQQHISNLGLWLKDHQHDAELDKQLIVFRQLVQQLSAAKEKAEQLEKEQAALGKQQQQAQGFIQDTTAKISLAEQQLKTIQEQIELHMQSLTTVLDGKTNDQLEEELSALPALVSTAEQQLRLAHLQVKLHQDQALLTGSIIQFRREEQEAQALSHNLKLEHERETALLKDLQQIYELEVRVQKYDADRLQLQEEQPCPLCGSVHHPFVEGKYVSRVSESELRRNQQQVKLQLLQTQLDAQLIVINTLTHQLATGEKNQKLTADSILQTMEEFNSNNALLPKPLDSSKPDIIAAVIARKRTQQSALKSQLDRARQIQQEIIKQENLLVQQREALAAARNQLEQAALSVTFTEKQIAAAKQELSLLGAERQEKEAAAILLLEPFAIRFNGADAELIITGMNDRFLQYHQSQKDLGNHELDLRQLQTELKSIGLAIKEKEALLTTLNAQITDEQQKLRELQDERSGLFGTKDPVEERSALNTELKKIRTDAENLQQQLQQKQEKLKIVEDRQLNLNTSFLSTKKLFHEHLERLTSKLREEGMEAVSDLEKLFLPDDEASSAAELQRESAQRTASAKSMLNATEKEIETERNKALTEVNREILLPRLEEQGRTLNTLQEQKFKLNHRISEDDLLKQKHAEVALQIEQQQLESDRFQKLSALIGSADGKKFSRFAQGLTLARLTELANRHLLRLSDRYRILKSPEKDLDLQIIDSYQADVIRPMSTLSGGESFLVSLALALGLSDLASRKVQINSLFIDEGFGTLDADTLDTAITALENLQAGGKNIGIISHIEALKERIGTQIQLTKLPGGSSKISLFHYGTRVPV